MLEPAVTITDFVLFLLNAAFAPALLSARPSPLRDHFILFFASIGISALAGALSHGFFPEATATGVVLWRITLLSLGVVSAATFLVATDLLRPSGHGFFQMFAIVALVIYAVVVLFVRWTFAMALTFYIPSAVLMFVGFAMIISRWARPALFGVCGLLLTFVAAYIQQARIGIHRVYFDHNATYHLVQAIGLLLIFLGARGLATLRVGT